MYKIVVLLASLICIVKANAAIIEIDYEFDLNFGTVYECINEADTSSGTPSKCWTNAWFNPTIADTVVSDLDTVIIDISFLPGQRLRWYDDGISFFSGNSEQLQIGVGSLYQGFDTSGTRYSFAFKDVTGNALHDDVSWLMDPATHNGGGAYLQSSFSGITNLTDNYFEFSGITVEMDLFNLTTYPDNQGSVVVNYLDIFLISGNFETIQSSVAVPEPKTGVLFLMALLALMVRRKAAR